MAGTEEAPAKVGSAKAPALETPSDGLGTDTKGKQRFSTGKFLQNIFCRLLPPFSANPKPSVSQSPTSQTQPQPQSLSPAQQSPANESVVAENVDMAAVSAQPSVSRDIGNPLVAGCTVPTAALSRISVEDVAARPRSSTSSRAACTPAAEEKPIHQIFMDQALDMARLALKTNETPVGCVLVHNGAVIARGMNATNVTRNGTRHAEFMAISSLLSYRPEGSEVVETQLQEEANERADSDIRDDESELFPFDDDYVKKGHLYPYGQKLHRAPRVDRSILRECDLYVTVEPCVMCAGLLRQLGIQKVYFGAVNDKFGGTGGVFSIHRNANDPPPHTTYVSVLKSMQVAADAANSSRPDSSSSNKATPTGNRQGGDGGNVEPGFLAEGGWGRDEAVSLLRRFYVQENGRAPVPRKKEGRAARLAAMEAGDEGITAMNPSSEAEAEAEAGSDSVTAFSDDNVAKA